jgi:hypothetical protein
MNVRSFARAKAHEARPTDVTDVRDRCCEGDGSGRKRRKVSDRKAGEHCVLHPVVRETPSQRECPPTG